MSMQMIMITHAKDEAELQRDLSTWRDRAKSDPALIVAHHHMLYELSRSPDLKTDRHRHRHVSSDASYQGVRMVCLCDLWSIESADLGCDEDDDD
jgi:hypothetical protein